MSVYLSAALSHKFFLYIFLLNYLNCWHRLECEKRHSRKRNWKRGMKSCIDVYICWLDINTYGIQDVAEMGPRKIFRKRKCLYDSYFKWLQRVVRDKITVFCLWKIFSKIENSWNRRLPRSTFWYLGLCKEEPAKVRVHLYGDTDKVAANMTYL